MERCTALSGGPVLSRKPPKKPPDPPDRSFYPNLGAPPDSRWISRGFRVDPFPTVVKFVASLSSHNTLDVCPPSSLLIFPQHGSLFLGRWLGERVGDDKEYDFVGRCNGFPQSSIFLGLGFTFCTSGLSFNTFYCFTWSRLWGSHISANHCVDWSDHLDLCCGGDAEEWVAFVSLALRAVRDIETALRLFCGLVMIGFRNMHVLLHTDAFLPILPFVLSCDSHTAFDEAPGVFGGVEVGRVMRWCVFSCCLSVLAFCPRRYLRWYLLVAGECGEAVRVPKCLCVLGFLCDIRWAVAFAVSSRCWLDPFLTGAALPTASAAARDGVAASAQYCWSAGRGSAVCARDDADGFTAALTLLVPCCDGAPDLGHPDDAAATMGEDGACLALRFWSLARDVWNAGLVGGQVWSAVVAGAGLGPRAAADPSCHIIGVALVGLRLAVAVSSMLAACHHFYRTLHLLFFMPFWVGEVESRVVRLRAPVSVRTAALRASFVAAVPCVFACDVSLSLHLLFFMALVAFGGVESSGRRLQAARGCVVSAFSCGPLGASDDCCDCALATVIRCLEHRASGVMSRRFDGRAVRAC